MPGDQGKIERGRNDLVTILERARGGIRMKVAMKDQRILLDAVDRVAESVAIWDVSGINSNLMRGKDDVRKTLRGRPVDMVLILNEFDAVEQEVNKLIPLMSKKKH